MSYCISNILGIRVGGVFSGDVVISDIKERIKKIVLSLRSTENHPDLGDKDGDVSHCMSDKLTAHKGSYVVIAGVFNYWNWDQVSVFAKAISKEFGTEVMLMSWDEEQGAINSEVFFGEEALSEAKEGSLEYSLDEILRRTL